MQMQSEPDKHRPGCQAFSSGLTGKAAVHGMKTFLCFSVLVYTERGKLTYSAYSPVRQCLCVYVPALT